MKYAAFRARAVAAAALMLSANIGPAAAQQQPDWKLGPHAPAAWTALSQLPDFNGVWELGFGAPPLAAAAAAPAPAGGPAPARPPAARRGAAPQPQLTPAYAVKLAEYRAAQAKGDIEDEETANCVPPGMPGIMSQPYPIEFMLTPGKVTILSEAYTQVRHIYTDGRPHPDDPDLTWHGHSTGKWENGTLVVDSVGFSPETTLAAGVGHGAKMHIIERMRLTTPDLLEIVTTVTDPEALTAPWVATRNYARHRDWTTAEYVCQENNRNAVFGGKAAINLK